MVKPVILAVDDDSVLTRLIFPNEHERWAQEIVRREYVTVNDPRRSDHVAAQRMHGRAAL